MELLKKIIILMFTVIFTAGMAGIKASAEPQKEYSSYTVCVDPGHQKKGNSGLEPVAPGSKTKKAKVTSGTRGVATKIPEYVFNLNLALKVRDRLETDGFKVVMTRTTHDVNISNVERSQIANNANADLFLRIHADGSTDKKVKGISVLYPALTISDKDIYQTSRYAADLVLKGAVSATGAKSKGIVARNDMTGFNWCTVPSVLIEAGFMSNPDEDKLLASDDYQDKLADGIVKGVEEYFNEKIKEKN